jgi:hypothetical protein
MRWVEHVENMGENSKYMKHIGRKPEGQRSLRRSRRKQQDSIKMDLKETGMKDLDYIHPAQDRN